MADRQLQKRIAELKRQMTEAQRNAFEGNRFAETADYGEALKVMDEIEAALRKGCI